MDVDAPVESLLAYLAMLAEVGDRNAAALHPHWRYRSWAALLLDQGAIFTPAADGAALVPRRWQGPGGTCFRSASRWSRGTGLAYVEGVATVNPMFGPTEHAWCADTDGLALDPTWLPGDGTAYVGLPVTADYRRTVSGHQLLSPHTDTGLSLLRDGLPEGTRADIGIPASSICVGRLAWR